MFDLRPVLYVFSLALVACGLFETLPGIVEWASGHDDAPVYFASAAVAIFVGGALAFTTHQTEVVLNLRQAFLLTPLCWFGLPVFASLPFVFPATRIGHEYYGDGALRQIAPLSPAIHLGAEKLFVIGARDGKISGEPERREDIPYPSIGQVSGQLLDIVFNDNLEADVERLQRINSTLDTMLPERRAKTALRHLDVLMVRPSRDIRDIAGEHVYELPWTAKMLLHSMGAMKAPWVLPSYLLFEPGYIRALMDLGFHDANMQMDEIRAFLEL